jgi:thiol-disulfide isomerase/thioredoxin
LISFSRNTLYEDEKLKVLRYDQQFVKPIAFSSSRDCRWVVESLSLQACRKALISNQESVQEVTCMLFSTVVSNRYFSATRQIIGGLIVGFAGVALAFTGTSHPEWIGRAFPDTDAIAQQNRLDRAALNGPAVFTFAIPNCGNCSLQVANLGILLEKTPNLKVLIVASENSENTRLLQRMAPSAKFLVDAEGTLIKPLGLRRVPATIFVDAKNIVQGYYEGPLERSETLELGQALFAGTALKRLIAPGGVGAIAEQPPGVTWSTANRHMLVFHGLDCSACKSSIPEIQKFAKQNLKVPVWVVTQDEAKQVRKQFGTALPNIKVVTIKENQFYKSYAITGTPTHILVAKDGFIVWRSVGYAPGVLNAVPL